MAIRGILARFECDNCGGTQEIWMDPALEINGGSLADAAIHCAKEDLLDVEIDDENRFTCGICLRKKDEVDAYIED
jgi:hypothetical protein